MSNLVTITSKFFDADGKALAGLSVKSRYLNSSRANLTQTDPKGYFKFEASPNRTVEILAKPPNEKEYKVFKTINSSKTSSMVHPIEVKLPKTLEEYKQINKRGLVKNYFKVVDCNGKIMANFPVQTRPKGKSSFERKTDKKGILEVASSPNRDIEFLVMDSSDKFVLKKEMNSGMGASTTILIKLDEAYSAFKSKGILELVDREGNTLTDIKVNVLMEIIESGTKKNYSISDGKLPIISHVGQELRFTIFKPDGKRLDSQSFTVDRINYRSLKLKIDVDINEGSTNKNEPKIDLALQAKNCGLEFRGKVKCTRYKKKFGPLYSGIKPFSAYDKWDMLISSGKISYDDQIVLMGVAPNEGNFDAVQSYDSEIITAGAMQKTINSSGTGELAEQIYKFKE